MSDFVRTTKSAPCPICGKAGWCTISTDGTVACCMRVEQGAFTSKETGAGLAHFHKIGDDTDYRQVTLPPKQKKRPKRDIDWNSVCRDAEERIGQQRLEGLAGELGLSASSLKRLGAGWWARHNGLVLNRDVPSESQRGYTFPMSAADGKRVGVRLRLIDRDAIDHYETNKIGLPGSAGDGLFIPSGLGVSDKPFVVIVEGPTDCAAVLDMGFDCIGRPSNTAGTDHLRRLIVQHTHGYGWREVVILIDRDKPGSDAARNTWAGARRLADKLASPRRSVRICRPPAGIKDAREWLNKGAGEDDLMAVIDDEEPVTKSRFEWMREVAA